MTMLLKNGEVYLNHELQQADIYIDKKGRMYAASDTDLNEEDVDQIIDCTGLLVTAGLIDTHVHLREPGFEYKETIRTGTRSMAKGGYTTVMSMPNLKPVPSTVENLKIQLDIIQKDAKIHVIPFASITVDQSGRSQLSDMEGLAPYVLGFSDDGKGVQTEDLMREAMIKAKGVDRVISAHCEDESELKPGGCIHEGKKAQELGLTGINSESEWKQIERDLKLSEETGCQYHVCHVSCKESVDLIRKAKARGVNVSCEVTVHHLLLNEEDILCDDGRYKMNPPLRTREDQQALLEGVKDGTIEVIATDHAPHSKEEKSRGLAKSAMGIIGSELAFGLLYRNLVLTHKLTLEQVLDCMTSNPAEIFGINGGEIENFAPADIAVFDLNEYKKIEEKDIVSMGKSTPFIGQYMQGICKLTIVNGRIVYREGI